MQSKAVNEYAHFWIIKREYKNTYANITIWWINIWFEEENS